YPSLKAQNASYNRIIKSISPSVLKAFGASGSSVNSLTNFLATKLYGFSWPLIIIFLSVTLAVSTIVGEIEKTTLGIWLSAPVSRLSIYWSKFAAGVIWIVISVAITIMAVIPLAAAYHSSLDRSGVLYLGLVGGLFALSVFALSMLISTLCSKASRAYVPIGIILIAMFTLNVVAALNSHLEKLQYVSYFYYFNATSLLNNAQINHASLYVFVGTIVIAGLLGSYVFKKRDFII
ncbi:MAG TPA: ABC transporter permease subunit, partial [Candidatus Saccharimonadales bacterium]